MNLQPITIRWSAAATRIRGMFNLNDPRWGRGDDGANERPSQPSQNSDGDRPASPPPPPQQPSGGQQRPGGQGGGVGGPPDLDELWRDFNRKLGQMFGQRGGGGGGQGGGPRGPSGPSGRGPRLPGFVGQIGAGVVLGAAALVWLGSGFFIVQEGQQAVITQFGKFSSTVGAGINWRLPWPIQRHELVYVSQIRSIDIGRDNIIKATGLRESAMLTEDENIVEIKFAVQYRLNDARAYLFESRNPTEAVVQAAETAVREVVGQMKMDSALAEERDQIAPRVRKLMQSILDRYKVGIEVVGINLQQGGVRPPEQVQAAFDDVLKAGQERERAKNEAQAYANDVIPRAAGAAARLKEEANAYRERIVAQAEGDAQRFKSILPEYQKAPLVTRERMYLETWQQIYGNVTKVLIDSRQGSNLLYLPLDKIMQQVSQASQDAAQNGAPAAAAAPAVEPVPLPDARSRDTQRSRERDVR